MPQLEGLPDSVWKRTAALNTWGTNAIEGNTLTHDDVERLLVEDATVPGRPVPDVLETLGHEEAFRSLLVRRKNPIDLVSILELHETVFRAAPRKRPGQWRVSNVYIAGTSFRPPRRDEVVPLVEAWCIEVAKRLRAKSSPLGNAAWMHHRFEQIHPFEDGNGRAGRLLMNLFLVKAGWPPLHILPPDRAGYIRALEEANGGDLVPLEHLLRTCMARGILDLLDQIGAPHDELRDIKEFAGKAWVPHKADYLALRCRQGVIPGIRSGETSGPVKPKAGRPRWLTSEVALRLVLESDAATRPSGASRA
ncbi:MAG: Fic family protein [Candidatus Thermoplasmatota archaeon]